MNLDQLSFPSDTWTGEADLTKKHIIVGAQQSPQDIKYRIFEDQRFNYQDEIIYKLSHEISHHFTLSQILNDKNTMLSDLFESFLSLRQQNKKLGFSALGSYSYYQGKGPEAQATEDLGELVNMYLQDPAYFKRYLDFISNPANKNQVEEIGVLRISPESANNAFTVIESIVNEYLKQEDLISKKPRLEPIKVTPEQNLQAAQFFCHNLREKLKSGTMKKWDDSRFIFTDPESGIFIKAQSKNAVDTAWTDSNTFIEWASKHNLPIVIWHQVDGGHYTLLLKGPGKQPDGQYKVLIYNPFSDQETYETVPINEEFADFKKRELPKLHYNEDLQRYDLTELGDSSYVEKDRVDQYLFNQWFKLPPQRSYQASEQAYQQLVSQTNPYNLSIAEDAELPWELKVGKGQRFQFNGYDCGPLSFYSSVLRYAALPKHENGKKQLVDSFAQQFDVRILTRKELLGR